MIINTKKIKIIQVKSKIGCLKKHRRTLLGLGLRHIGDVVEREDSPSIRGMVNKISHIVHIQEG
ncbi:50S ribosomal protein L30 [Buchnera aphidicola]|uniref:Large ribosomal subunit protein uL30 n=1 Tax=Buchnera aphidicola (Stegophylla sp.) TaxID=2315800 RepID=A0A4D6YKR3_9GAMM|nr:50S ribosomal protein L30 [Buchnera aphidicola (Stegophylla sp.)]QCI26470.1 50S ribosomal protein L30 [Buchnera aphidicola (Stegophylla sp.)]